VAVTALQKQTSSNWQHENPEGLLLWFFSKTPPLKERLALTEKLRKESVNP